MSLSLNIFDFFTYEYHGDPSGIFPGMRVVIPVGNRLTTGWVIDTGSKFSGKVKRILGTIEGVAVSDRYLAFARSVSETYFVSLGNILDYSLSPLNRSIGQLYFNHQGKTVKVGKVTPEKLNALASDRPLRFYAKYGVIPDTPENGAGVSGKESGPDRFILAYDRLNVYRDIIRSCLEKKRGVLLVVPDGLTGVFYHDSMPGSDLYLSHVNPRQRDRIWCDYARGKPGVVIGGLLAVMLPVGNLGCVISERAGSSLYQKQRFTVFNLNRLAALRARAFNIPLVEGFSTYTSRAFARRKRLKVDDMRESKKIDVEVRPLSGREKGIPDPLLDLMKDHYRRNKKILLIVNKKKSSRFLFCRKCNRIQRCPGCSGLLAVNEKGDIRCGRCGFRSIETESCVRCGNPLVTIPDMSMESIRDMIEKKIAERDVVAVSADDLGKGDPIVEVIKNKRVVVSTPVLINPLFKDTFDTIVYLRPETVFSMNEYNTGEMIFSTVSELKELVKSGGFIYVFSVFHFHYSLKLIPQEENFFRRELKYRQWFLYPPNCNVYLLEIRSKTLRALGAEMRSIYARFKNGLKIRHLFLDSRHRVRGNFKGKIEIHCEPGDLVKTGLLQMRNIHVDLVAS